MNAMLADLVGRLKLGDPIGDGVAAGRNRKTLGGILLESFELPLDHGQALLLVSQHYLPRWPNPLIVMLLCVGIAVGSITKLSLAPNDPRQVIARIRAVSR